LSLFGQTKDVQKEEMVKAQKIAFFTEKLNLTTEEAQLFWPVYNEYWQKKNKIIDDRRNAMKFCSENLEKLSDKEIERYGDLYINFHKQESDLLIEFNEKFKKVLTPEKVIKLYFADYEFKTYLLQQIRNAPKKE
jgi:Spy/CpxP family protein refolding chaperone